LSSIIIADMTFVTPNDVPILRSCQPSILKLIVSKEGPKHTRKKITIIRSMW
jgi:hypothetical protein